MHADLFRDNALFVDGRITGVIDFYYAHTGPLLYDLAVTLADWCWVPVKHGSALDADGARALLRAYQAERPLTTAERRGFSDQLRRAALRFWLSRLYDQHHPREGSLTQTKDPAPFRRLLEACRQDPTPFETLLK